MSVNVILRGWECFISLNLYSFPITSSHYAHLFCYIVLFVCLFFDVCVLLAHWDACFM